jgi:predicted DNA-binding transcriptional regulator YafY
VSPQRLVYYRENWYLDTWCHLRNDLRSFSVDGIRKIEIAETPAKDMSLKALEEYLHESYGIVRGGEAQRAKLRFSVERARWVASEVWHPDQKGSFDAEGRYIWSFRFATTANSCSTYCGMAAMSRSCRLLPCAEKCAKRMRRPRRSMPDVPGW